MWLEWQAFSDKSFKMGIQCQMSGTTIAHHNTVFNSIVYKVLSNNQQLIVYVPTSMERQEHNNMFSWKATKQASKQWKKIICTVYSVHTAELSLY